MYVDQDDLCSDPLTKSNILNKHSVFTNEVISQIMPRLSRSSYPTMSHITIDTPGVENPIRNPHNATGPDAIPAHILSELSTEVDHASTFVFRMSLDTGQIPDDWRMANVVPF